jgi:hypothetical protein
LVALLGLATPDLRYTPATHWVIGVRVPWVESRWKRPGAATETISGLGDVVVSVKHRVYRTATPVAGPAIRVIPASARIRRSMDFMT